MHSAAAHGSRMELSVTLDGSKAAQSRLWLYEQAVDSEEPWLKKRIKSKDTLVKVVEKALRKKGGAYAGSQVFSLDITYSRGPCYLCARIPIIRVYFPNITCITGTFGGPLYY